ncbi:hypothetical protein HWV62_29823 [Athelia sp. TMB]|nr:hypothetical protein HWV62_29823 [Athelia sp. TMB]
MVSLPHRLRGASRLALVPSTLPFLGLFAGVLCAVLVNLANARIAATGARGEVSSPRASSGSGGPPRCPSHGPRPPSPPSLSGQVNTVFQQCINFLVDMYALHAASAVSANAFLRSVLGVGRAMSVLGGVAALAVPAPLLFMRYSVRLPRKSKFALFEG